MNILVTGGAGFIGSHFIRYILREHSLDTVTNLDALTYAGSLDNLKDVQKSSRYKFFKGNICDYKFLNGLFKNNSFDAVINFAAESHVDRSIKNPSIFVKTNVLGTNNLLDISERSGVKTVLQISTDEVYGDSPEEGGFEESDLLMPSSPYAASKAAADMLALSYFKTYGLNVRITRSSNNYGPNQFPEKLIPLMITHGLSGKTLPLYGDGHNKRVWLYVSDNCRAIDMVLRNGKPGEVYNISGNDLKSNKEIAQKILSELRINKDKIQYVKDRPGNDEIYLINDSKIRNGLNWTPAVGYNQGLKETIQWYAEHVDWWKEKII